MKAKRLTITVVPPLYQYLKWCQSCFQRNMIHHFPSRALSWFTFCRRVLFKQGFSFYIFSLGKSIYFTCTVVWIAPATQLAYMLQYTCETAFKLEMRMWGREVAQNKSQYLMFYDTMAFTGAQLLQAASDEVSTLEVDITSVTEHLIPLEWNLHSSRALPVQKAGKQVPVIWICGENW